MSDTLNDRIEALLAEMAEAGTEYSDIRTSTIETLCAVAKAAKKHYEDDNLNIALNDLYDALRKE